MITEVPFDAIITVFVFLIGIPAIVLQTLPVDVRHVLGKRWSHFVRAFGWPILIALFVVATGIAVSRIFGMSLWVWSLIMATLFAIVLLTAFLVPRLYMRRDALVNLLVGEATRGLDDHCYLDEEALDDLIDLGRTSKPGREKTLVLNALLDITHRVCHHPKYRGDALGDLILGVIDLVGLGALPEARSVATAAGIVREVVARYETISPAPDSQTDLIMAIRATSNLGRLSLRLDNQSISLGIVQVAGNSPGSDAMLLTSQTLFEIGVAAVDEERLLIAMAALSRLITLLQSEAPAEGELAADTLGLLAHFWANGNAGRSFARRRLQAISESLARDPATALGEAADHSASITNFRTANLLRDMAQALAS